MMIFGYEVGSTKAVVIGRSNLVQDQRGTRRVQKRVQKKGPKRDKRHKKVRCSQISLQLKGLER